MSKKDPLVSVIITNHNGLRFLNSCIKSIYQQTYQPIEIILVDNASSDNSVGFVKTSFPKVKVIAQAENLGYAAGNNLGLSKALGKYILILNNDTVLQPNTLFKLMEAFHHIPSLAVVQPMIKLHDDSLRLDSCGSFWTSTGFNYHFGNYKSIKLKKYRRAFPVYSVKGACMLISRDIIDKIGLFDHDFWCYFEETDFCHRAWISGWQCWYYPQAEIRHHVGGTSLKKNQSEIQFHSIKNRICSYLKNLDTMGLLTVVPTHVLLILLWGFWQLLHLRWSLFFVPIRAVAWNISNFPNTMNKRHKIQNNLRQVPDSEFLPGVTKNPRLSYYYYLLTDLRGYRD